MKPRLSKLRYEHRQGGEVLCKRKVGLVLGGSSWEPKPERRWRHVSPKKVGLQLAECMNETLWRRSGRKYLEPFWILR